MPERQAYAYTGWRCSECGNEPIERRRVLVCETCGNSYRPDSMDHAELIPEDDDDA